MQVTGAAVTADFFRVLGVPAAIGRTFLPGEEGPSSPRVAILNLTAARMLFPGEEALGKQEMRAGLLQSAWIGQTHIEDNRIDVFRTENLERRADRIGLMRHKAQQCERRTHRRAERQLVFNDQNSGAWRHVMGSSVGCR